MNLFWLFWLDLRTYGSGLALALVVFAAHGAVAFPFPAMYLLLTILFPVFLAVGPLLLEAKCATDRFWVSLPIRREELVIARYLTTAAGAALGLGAALGYALLLTAIVPARWPVYPPLLVASVATGLAFALAWLLAAYLPLVFGFGPAKAPLVFTLFLLGALVVAGAVQHVATFLFPAAGQSWVMTALRAPGRTVLRILGAAQAVWGAPLLLILLLGLTLAVIAGSLALSIRLYARRDL